MTLPRAAQPTLNVIQTHCADFEEFFAEVRTFENFQALHVGLLSDSSRKTLPAIAQRLGLNHQQGLHHLLVTPHLKTAALREKRLGLTRELLGSHPITLMIDETGDRKKGRTTDYVSRQYLGSLGKIDNGLVTVHIIALLGHLTFPLTWRVFKPKSRLREGDVHASKLALAIEMLKEIAQWGLHVELVVGDSAYGMSGEVVRCLKELNWDYALSIRSDFALRLSKDEEVWCKPWVQVERRFVDGETQLRWAQEVVWGKERAERYVLMTTDKTTQPANETSFVRTNLSGEGWLGHLPDAYGRRTWVEAAFRNQKTELGWHDWRLTRWEHIERWYEMVLSAYLLVSREAFRRVKESPKAEGDSDEVAPLTKDSRPPQSRWCDALAEIRCWVKPLEAVMILLSWSTVLALEQNSLHAALAKLYALPFLQ